MAKYFPDGYIPLMERKQTEKAIKYVKDTFERELSGGLMLSRVTSPLFVPRGSGINDDLNGVERPVVFQIGNFDNKDMEIVQSLAKWQRLALATLGFKPGTGLYTDMNAIRPDDDLDAIHSIYVDQWDWELVITEEQRSLDFLKFVVSKIYSAMRRTEFLVCEMFPVIKPTLPEKITFIHAEEALRRYPNLSVYDREYELAKEYGAVFIIGIGAKLSDGASHGGRAPDYDDWSTPNSDGYLGLNGDIVVWDPIRKNLMEITSMGIRVNPESLIRQLTIRGMEERANLYWHKRLLANEMPLTIGGGIGQSRLCMYFLKKAHIGEVQASIWPQDVMEEAASLGVVLM